MSPSTRQGFRVMPARSQQPGHCHLVLCIAAHSSSSSMQSKLNSPSLVLGPCILTPELLHQRGSLVGLKALWQRNMTHRFVEMPGYRPVHDSPTLALPSRNTAQNLRLALAYLEARYTIDLDHTRVRYLTEKTPLFRRYLIRCFPLRLGLCFHN
jgi:hypothetical protein